MIEYTIEITRVNWDSLILTCVLTPTDTDFNKKYLRVEIPESLAKYILTLSDNDAIKEIRKTIIRADGSPQAEWRKEKLSKDSEFESRFNSIIGESLSKVTIKERKQITITDTIPQMVEVVREVLV